MYIAILAWEKKVFHTKGFSAIAIWDSPLLFSVLVLFHYVWSSSTFLPSMSSFHRVLCSSLDIFLSALARTTFETTDDLGGIQTKLQLSPIDFFLKKAERTSQAFLKLPIHLSSFGTHLYIQKTLAIDSIINLFTSFLICLSHQESKLITFFLKKQMQ